MFFFVFALGFHDRILGSWVESISPLKVDILHLGVVQREQENPSQKGNLPSFCFGDRWCEQVPYTTDRSVVLYIRVPLAVSFKGAVLYVGPFPETTTHSGSFLLFVVWGGSNLGRGIRVAGL